jgi:hypothetical protein
MNINLLADDPSVKWYFIVAVPFLVLVLGVALVLNYAGWIKAHYRNLTSFKMEKKRAAEWTELESGRSS